MHLNAPPRGRCSPRGGTAPERLVCQFDFVEPMAGFEPATSSLPRKCSTPELHRQLVLFGFASLRETLPIDGAEDGAQTRDPQLGRLMLYQLSYFRNSWAKMDSNHRRRKPADLQSAPFGHSGIRPNKFCQFSLLQPVVLPA